MNYEKMTIEIIEFLQKWGLWECTMIFSDGNMYAFSLEETDVYKGIPYVKFKRNVDPTKYTTEDGCDFSNPGHLFDMVFDGPLYSLLVNEEYEVELCELGDDAWEEIFQHTDFISDYIPDYYEVFDAEELLQKIVFREKIEGDILEFDPSDIYLEFDSWDEYLEFCGVEIFYDSKKSVDGYQILDIDDIVPLWDKIIDETKTEIKHEHNFGIFPKYVNTYEIRDYVIGEFNKIFKKYGLWYDFGFCWSLSCYK